MNDRRENPSISIEGTQLGSESQSSSDSEENKDFGTCEKCKQKNTGYMWCNSCNVKRFESEWKEWTSGSKEIDEFIQEIQRDANEYREFIEWIPFEKFKDIELVARGGFGVVYKAIWTEGYNRPTAKELMETFEKYYEDVDHENEESEIYRQVKSIENSISRSQFFHPNDFSPLKYTTNSNAVYTSRLLKYSSQLPEPVNATPAESKQLELQLPSFDDLEIE
ncbi:1293_t:CDS:2 [Acaulospora colombiana]|uniref:1293_t:CDS:1 n=1 Tax=Acaulospora colombiana TaxID=27376 RepID=A0ACA9LQI0_9GLOM|nr:1293_t:CDS:2 [Acaulospora colombiana]